VRKTKSIIRDGYYYTALIPGKADEYGELEISYRPVLPEEVDIVFEKQEVSRKEYHAAVRDAMVKHIREWSEWDDVADAMVSITADTVGRLPQGLFWATWNKLFSTVEVEEEVKN